MDAWIDSVVGWARSPPMFYVYTCIYVLYTQTHTERERYAPTWVFIVLIVDIHEKYNCIYARSLTLD